MDARLDLADGRPRPPRHTAGPTRRTVIARYSRFVTAMKLLLPAVAVALLGLLVVWPRLNARLQRATPLFINADGAKIDTMTMSKPRYFGTDKRNLPYTVTARLATQVSPDRTVVTLDHPIADMTRPDGTGIVVNANVGFFRQKDQTLDLLGKVDLYRDDGYELHTNSARIFVDKGNAQGDDPIRGQGPGGTLVGEGFRLHDRGHVIDCTGHCEAVLAVAAHKTKGRS